MLHLKSQVNPHFFFNTFNTLYGLVEKNPKR
jgi:two-component system sensor histidine kinase AlgZ